MDSAKDLIEKWDGHIVASRYDETGTELLSSKIRRAVDAHAKQKAAEKIDPRLAEERRKRLEEGEREQRERIRSEHENRHWNEMPKALRAMGLKDQELDVIAAMDEDWPAWRQVQAWKASEKLFLTMGGPTGTGKTIAAARLLCDCREFYKTETFEGWFWRSSQGKFTKAGELARFSYYDKSDRLYLDRLELTKWLILDDLGAEQMSEPWIATLLGLLDARARNKCRTVITTNLSFKQLFGDEKTPGRYDIRIKRRLSDFGEFVGASKRKEAA